MGARWQNLRVDNRIKDLINFDILKNSEGEVRAQFTVDEGLPSFEGHFPGNPILPAVSIIDISLYLLSHQVEGVSHSHIEVKRSKFMGMVRPKQQVEIVAETSDSHNWKIIWQATEDQARLAHLHLVI